jgi:iron complex transport system ATP-binding protein
VSLEARGLRLSYGRREVVGGVNLVVRPGEIVALLGSNGSGKSTLLRGLGRLLRPVGGVVELDGRAIASWPPDRFARRVALLAQTHESVGEMTVRDLVALGRHPHQGFLSLPTAGDAMAIENALTLTGLTQIAERRVGELSGGETQRAWIALALAQNPEIMLLDEPTTFLDLAHQLSVLELIQQLNRVRGLTIVMALHDLSQAARYADRLVLLKDGSVIAEGPVETVLNPDLIQATYGVEVEIVTSDGGIPVIIPLRAATPGASLVGTEL